MGRTSLAEAKLFGWDKFVLCPISQAELFSLLVQSGKHWFLFFFFLKGFSLFFHLAESVQAAKQE